MDKYDLHHDAKTDKWRLEKEGSDKAVRTFEKKSDATKGGALKAALPAGGGSVRIKKKDGTIQEERTIAPAKDPRKSKG